MLEKYKGLTVKNEPDTYNVQYVEVTPSDISNDIKDIISRYDLKNNVIEKHFAFIAFGGKKQLYITASGVNHIAKGLLKRISIVSKPSEFLISHSDRIVCAIVIVEIEDKNGVVRQSIGTSSIDNRGIHVAIKIAETNAIMRGIRSLVGFPIPDEAAAREIVTSESR